MNRTWIGAAALGLALCTAGAAHARNPHCAGGIQYLTQWVNDKAKGNIEDYQRELTKSIQQLEICAAEDPKDFEALGYLAWSYAEAESAAAAGRMFKTAYDGLMAKGDRKRADLVKNNQESYWATAFNAGIDRIKSAQDLFPDFCSTPSGAEDQARKAEAARKYEEAAASLTRASLLRPGEVRTLRNLGTIHALRCEYREAEARFREALAIAPNDSDLVRLLRDVRGNYGNRLIEEKKYDEAVAFYARQLESDAGNADLLIGLGDAHYQRALAASGDEKKKEFVAAAGAYGRASAARPTNPDLPFNAALSYQNGGDYANAAKLWRKALELKPEDPQILSSLGASLAELKEFDEAIRVLHKAVVTDPKDKNLHRQLGAVYTKAGNNQKSTEELMVYLALANGKPAADPAAEARKAPASSQAGKTLASVGVPELVVPWTADNEQWETWFYWNKRTAYHFKGGSLAQKSDWTAPDLKTTASGK